MKRRRPVVQWKDESKNVKRRRASPELGFSPDTELLPGAMFVSHHVWEARPNEQWDVPTLVPRRRHRKKKQVTVMVYIGSVRLEEARPDGRRVSHIKRLFFMESGRYIVDRLEYLMPATPGVAS